MRKKDYNKVFNFFEYEQSLSEEKNAPELEKKSVEDLALDDSAFSVINAPELTPTQNKNENFYSLFEDEKTTEPMLSEEEIKTTPKQEPVVEVVEKIISEEPAKNEEETTFFVDDNQLIDDEPIKEAVIDEDSTNEELLITEDKQPISEEDAISEEQNTKPEQENSEEDFAFAVEVAAPIPTTVEKPRKLKSSFLRVFKKVKDVAEEETSDEFFVEPVVPQTTDIDNAQLSFDLDNTEISQEEPTSNAEEIFTENTPLEEQTGQQFFEEAILNQMPLQEDEITEENLEIIPTVTDEVDVFFEEPLLDESAKETSADEIVFDEETEDDEEIITEEELEVLDETHEAVFYSEEPAIPEPAEEIEEKSEELQPEESTNASAKILTYDELKRTPRAQFETPYIIKGKKGEHIRFRLSFGEESSAKKAHFLQLVKEYAILIASALLIGLFLNFFIFTFAHVKGSSMEPTLHSKQITLVSRLDYQFSEIERGDIVITRFPSEVYDDIYVKRVIALSLETIEIKDGFVYVNGVALEEDYIAGPCRDDMAPFTVPEGYVFVMGDNRPDSADSRIVGPVPKDMIIGKAKFIVFPEIKSIED